MPASSPPAHEPYFNLGPLHRAVTTSSPHAQLWCTRGLLWAYSFHFGEAARCFERAVAHDPSCAMALWGIAYAAGPNYNKAWRYFDPKDLRASIERANSAISRAASLPPDQTTPVEQALVNAIAARFPHPTQSIPSDLRPLDRAYADAMRPVYHSFSTDPDIAALFADALMCMTPRGLWDLDTGQPTGPHAVEAQTVIETAFRLPGGRGRDHPALCHLYIHAMEMSPTPELALPAADRLRSLVPDASHMLHMPTHIDAAVGDYRRAIASNTDAIAADDKYFALEENSSLSPSSISSNSTISSTAYRVHYICAKVYAAMMSGRFEDALSAAEKIEQVLPDQVLSITTPPVADLVEAFLGSRAHVLVRFGRWDEILRLQLPLPAARALKCASTAVILYARSLALSALGRIDEAEACQVEFENARLAVPSSRLNSIPCKQVEVLNVASAMLHGELEYRKGNVEGAFSSLRRAIQLENALPYSDPPPWMQPVRHALGGLLLEQNRVEEAEVLFREDLGFAKGFPRRKARVNNVWGLHGLYECFARLGKTDELLFVKSARDVALAAADVAVAASCFCRLSAVDDEAEKSKCCL